VNGQLTKKFLLFPVECENYTQLARQTAGLFGELIFDYFRPVGWKEPNADNSIFIRMKTVCKKVKQAFCSTNYEVRYSVFDLIAGEHKHCKFAKFWQPCLTRLKRRVEKLESDYTTSIAWVNTMSGFSQTRNLGYLPPWVADVKRKEFRDTIGRPKVEVSKEKLSLIRKAVQRRQLEMGIEINFLQMSGRDKNRDFQEVINAIKLPLKPTASINSTVHQGGKVEDARQLLQDAMLHRWRIPVRDLEYGTIVEWIQISPDTATEKPPPEGYLFWASLQITVNWFARKYNKYKDLLYELPGSEPWENDLWRMSIVHISEPGKERNLTKTSAPLSWVLTVASKVSQMVLAFNQDHRAGLILSAQDWMHQRRVSPESYESEWMYDRATRKRMAGTWNGFQDWKESTDFIPRRVGGMALNAWFEYIAFPRWYGDLVVLITQRDYAVSEYTHTEWVHNVTERHYYQGSVQEGFMMSMPLTKTVLHLMHDVNIGVIHLLLEGLGVKIVEPKQRIHEDLERNRPGQLRIQPSDVGMSFAPHVAN
jgi:hypothetical protein